MPLVVKKLHSSYFENKICDNNLIHLAGKVMMPSVVGNKPLVHIDCNAVGKVTKSTPTMITTKPPTVGEDTRGNVCLHRFLVQGHTA
jgi:hypothetical protein